MRGAAEAKERKRVVDVASAALHIGASGVCVCCVGYKIVRNRQQACFDFVINFKVPQNCNDKQC